MRTRILHTCIRVKNLEESIKFYKEALGFFEKTRKDFPKHKFTIVYLIDGDSDHELELTYNYDKEHTYEIGNGFSHIAVGVENLEGLRDDHIKKGYEVTDLKGLPGEKPRYYFVTDPDGYKIEVIRQD